MRRPRPADRPMGARSRWPARALRRAHARWLAARTLADVRGDEVRLGLDGSGRVGLSLTGDLGTKRVEFHRVNQTGRIARVANTRILAIDEQEGKRSARIVLVDDLLFLGVELLQA